MKATMSHLLGHRLLTDGILSATSPKVGGPPPIDISLAKLRRLVGMQFEYKLELQEFLTQALTVSAFIEDYDVTGNTPELREELVDTFIGCGPTMGFEAKKAAYGAFELICEALAAEEDFSEDSIALLNSVLLSCARYVGIAEGDHEDFHFMVATYNLAKAIVDVLADVVTPRGRIGTLTITTPGEGYTIDGVDEDATGVVFNVVSTEADPPANYVSGVIAGTIAGGELTAITAYTTRGEGYYVGQVLTVNISTTAAGQADAEQVTAATVTVATITNA